MGSQKKFIIISLAVHAVMILALVEVHLTGKRLDASAVYEVSIVAGAPSGGNQSAESSPVSRGKKFDFTRPKKTASIGEVRKERGHGEKAPEFSPSEIRPEAPAGGADMPETADLIKGQPSGGSSPARGAGGGMPAEVALWKARVRATVEGVWRMPPEIETMEASLQTTYLLRVSRTGELLQKKLLVSSGNVPFDRSILVALGKVTRFQPPPLVLIAGEDSVEVTMSFIPPKGAK